MSERSVEAERLELHYAQLESAWEVETAPEFALLVVPNGNAEAPIHRWFHLKEAYSSRLLERILKETGLAGTSNLRICDPYSGAGTTQISVADAVTSGDLVDPAVYGVEQNPFLHLVASAKLTAVQQPPKTFEDFAQEISNTVLASSLTCPVLPSLSTFHRAEYFDLADLHQLVRLRNAIEDAEQAGSSPVDCSLAMVCLGAIIESISNLRRDGRALRYADKGRRPAPIQAFLSKARQIQADLPATPIAVGGCVTLGDGRSFGGIMDEAQEFDLIIFSPPYPNNIDYTEVYKLENWLLGYITDESAFFDQRMRTVYSHPSLLRPDPLPSSILSTRENDLVAKVVAPLVDAVPKDRYSLARKRMLRGYALDMFLTLRSAAQLLAPTGHIAYVVGNSVHGRPPGEFVIAADLLMAQLAGVAGLVVERICVARFPRRRVVASPFLRESVVFLKPDGASVDSAACLGPASAPRVGGQSVGLPAFVGPFCQHDQRRLRYPTIPQGRDWKR